MGKYGWGTMLGKFSEFLPGREESLRNQIDKLEKKVDAILKEDSTPNNARKLRKYSRKLSEARKRLKNT